MRDVSYRKVSHIDRCLIYTDVLFVHVMDRAIQE